MNTSTSTIASNVSSANDYYNYSNYPEYKAGILVWKVVPPILILFGTIGNILAVIVLRRKANRGSTTAFYLTVLACSDLLVLYSGLLRQWMLYLFDKDVRDVSDVLCKINMFMVYFSLDYSAWILIAVTLERVIAAWFPHRAKSCCTRIRAVVFLIVIAIFLFCLNSHILFNNGLSSVTIASHNSSTSEIKVCKPLTKEYRDFFINSWSWIDLCTFCVIPFLFIVFGNTCILIRVLRSRNRTKARPQRGTSMRKNGHRTMSSMMVILFTLNIVFLVTTTPVSVYNVGYISWREDATAHDYAQLDLTWAIVNMLQYTNNSMNFMLYCLSGSKFRKEVSNIVSEVRHSFKRSISKRNHYNATPTASPRGSTIGLHSRSDITRLEIVPVSPEEVHKHTSVVHFKNGGPSDNLLTVSLC